MIQNKKKSRLLIAFLILFLIAFSIYFYLSPSTAQATNANFSGYAWSPNTGWLNFSGVKYDISTGDVSGYAWSSNTGWVQFGGLSGFPTGSGTVSTNANVNLTTGKMTGWAKVLSLPNPKDTESTEWADGWISLGGTLPAYTVGFNTTTGVANANSYAWGSNVLGWINFSNVKMDVSPSPSVLLNANPVNIVSGTSSALSWSGNNLTTSSTGCVASGGTSLWVGNQPSPIGTFSTGNLSTGSSPTTYTYGIKCLGVGTNGAVYSTPISYANVVVYPTGTCIDPTAQNYLSIGSCTYASCSNHLLDPGESAIDCGGICPPCKKPPHFQEN
jgi:hypothetical protein